MFEVVDETADAFPLEAPDLWFVSAVPFLIQFLQQYEKMQSRPGASLDALRKDLQMGEFTALEFIREVCLVTPNFKEPGQ
jgi:hypothetical protein